METESKVHLGRGYDAEGNERICVMRDYFGVNNMCCTRCCVREHCWRRVPQELVDRIVERINKLKHRSEFLEEYWEDLFD